MSTRLLKLTESFASSAVGLKPRTSALFLRAAKSRPELANRRVAAASVNQPAVLSFGAGSSLGGNDWRGPFQPLCTTPNG